MPKPEAMTAENFDEDDYRTNLIDKEGYSEETARMKAKKMKESFEAKKIESGGSLEKYKQKVWVKPTSKRKGHYREQEMGGGEKFVGYKVGSTVETKHGDGVVVGVDTTTYTYPMYSVNLTSGRFVGEKMYLPELDLKSISTGSAKIEIDLGSLAKAKSDEIEHLSPEERKKRQKDRDKRQKERAAHRIVRQKQHDEVEAGIPAGE